MRRARLDRELVGSAIANYATPPGLTDAQRRRALEDARRGELALGDGAGAATRFGRARVQPPPEAFGVRVTRASQLAGKHVGPPPAPGEPAPEYLDLMRVYGVLALFIDRGGDPIEVPTAGTVLQEGDWLYVLPAAVDTAPRDLPAAALRVCRPAIAQVAWGGRHAVRSLLQLQPLQLRALA